MNTENFVGTTEHQTSIRQFPQNYCLAVWDVQQNCWRMDPDLAADKQLVVALTLSLMEHSNKYTRDPMDAILGMGKHLDSYTPPQS